MRSLFTTGFVHPKDTAWMGQASAFVTTTPEDKVTKETSWLDVLATGITSTADIYGSYGDIQEGDATAAGREAEAAAKDAALRAQQIMQQTSLIQQQALAKQNQIMGVDKTAFFIGASLLGLGVLGATVYLLGKK